METISEPTSLPVTGIVTIDFETKPIINGSDSTPEPVGVSIKHDNTLSKYLAFGHSIGNNSTPMFARNAVQNCAGQTILCHNVKFDMRIAWEHWDISLPLRMADTMIMAYLLDPREASLGLKELALKYLDIKPLAKDKLDNWLKDHKLRPGADIWKAPGDMVGEYAESDTDMTYALYKYFVARFEQERPFIYGALEREMRLIPIVIKMEQNGLRLRNDIVDEYNKWQKEFDEIDAKLLSYGISEKPGSKAMFKAFADKGLLDKSKYQYTDKGNVKYGAEQLETYIKDKDLLYTFKRRSKLQKMIGTYLRPFAESAKKYDGRLYPYYNQTRNENDFGTRSGRFSSNIQQLPKKGIMESNEAGSHVADLPNPRSLIVAELGHTFVKRDFSSQEVRVLAHYAEGALLDGYNSGTMQDVHEFVADLIYERTGLRYARSFVKTISFLKIYGGGAKLLAKNLNITLDEAYQLFNAYDTALPEPKRLMKEIEQLIRNGKKIYTWGGRSYSVEIDKDGKPLYYKMLNLLIQGSSADMTKEAMIRYHYHPDRKGRIAMQVHDEIVLEVPDKWVRHDMAILKWAMDDMPGWDVKLESDGETGKNLYEMVKYND
jgi:DNA polymerase-1